MGPVVSEAAADVYAERTASAAAVDAEGCARKASMATVEKEPAAVGSSIQHIHLLNNASCQDFLSFVFSMGAVILIVVVLVLLGWDTLRHTINH